MAAEKRGTREDGEIGRTQVLQFLPVAGGWQPVGAPPPPAAGASVHSPLSQKPQLRMHGTATQANGARGENGEEAGPGDDGAKTTVPAG